MRRTPAFAATIAAVALTQSVHAGGACDNPGPDLIVGGIQSIQNWGESGGLHAYTFAPTLCNIGDAAAVFQASTNQHPVTVQNVYQWRPHAPGASHGEFRQIGMSWAFHHFFALASNLCCPTCTPTDGATLGIGCSNPESAGLTGSSTVLGPRSEVNPHTVDFVANHAMPGGPTVLAGRVQIDGADLDQTDAINAGSEYLVELHTLSPDDAANDAADNNASFRPLSVATTEGSHMLLYGGPTVESAGIYAWADYEPGVQFTTVDLPGDGRYIVASSASDEDGDGTWTYVYAVFNYNAADPAASFAVPVPGDVFATNFSAHDIDHHSGEAYDTTDWASALAGGKLEWQAPAFSPPIDRNAIRWGTMHTFSFDADAEPVSAGAAMTLLESGFKVDGFAVTAPRGAACVGDINGDGVTDTADLGLLIGAFGTSNAGADINGDGTVDTADLGLLIGVFDAPCP